MRFFLQITSDEYEAMVADISDQMPMFTDYFVRQVLDRLMEHWQVFEIGDDLDN